MENIQSYLVKAPAWAELGSTQPKLVFSFQSATNPLMHGSQSKLKCSIIQREQNTTKRNKIQHDKVQKFQNTDTTK